MGEGRPSGKTLTRRTLFRGAAAAGAVLCGAPSPGAAPAALEQGFRNPSDASRPWVFWWWLNGDVSREGITRDLEEMKRQGINGVLLFHADGADGHVPIGPRFLSPEWNDLFRFALQEASRLGLEVSINLCDGWDCGGPGIQPEHAAKRLVCSERQADGPVNTPIHLPAPPVLDGYYHEVGVVAFREKSRRPVQPAAVEASSSVEGYCNELNWPPLDVVDGDPNTFWRADPKFAAKSAGPQWIELRYHEPLAARAIQLASVPGAGPRDCELQASGDGKTFRSVAQFELEP
ncbi:MAG: discoidin domain-containing protein, partial [Acidobacteria bacterium]|nr:discoidin domain-containing protein [Acidobacteriota bacterium]